MGRRHSTKPFYALNLDWHCRDSNIIKKKMTGLRSKKIICEIEEKRDIYTEGRRVSSVILVGES